MLPAEWRLGSELLHHQLLHRVIEQSPTRPDAGLPVCAKQRSQYSMSEIGAIGDPDPGCKRLVVRLRQSGLNAFISGHNQAGRLDTRIRTRAHAKVRLLGCSQLTGVRP